jgi:hypothetical protein
MTTAGCSAIELGRAGHHNLIANINLSDLVKESYPHEKEGLFHILSTFSVPQTITYLVKSLIWWANLIIDVKNLSVKDIITVEKDRTVVSAKSLMNYFNLDALIITN